MAGTVADVVNFFQITSAPFRVMRYRTMALYSVLRHAAQSSSCVASCGAKQ